MRIIYCDNVLDPKIIEPDYAKEKKSAIQTGFTSSLINFEALVEGDIPQALKYVRVAESKTLGIYRGWMLTLVQYQLLYDGLLEKNIELINSPERYEHCHYLPKSYDKIKALTPKSCWTTQLSDNSIFDCTAKFGTAPIIVKDFVKSEKHHWETACYIPNASDQDHVKSVVDTFIELRGNHLNEGLVFRQFLPLKFLRHHSKSNMPLTKEFRLFFAYNTLIQSFFYWDEGEYDGILPDLTKFKNIAKNIDSNFFTMDVAQKKDGEWIIMELGDGQVAGLPERANTSDFYHALKNQINDIRK